MLCQFLLESKVNQIYTYIDICIPIPISISIHSTLFQILFPHGSSQSIEWSSLRCSAGHDQLYSSYTVVSVQGLPQGLNSKRISLPSRRCKLNPWRKTQQPIPVLLPGKSQGQRNPAGCSPWGCKRVGQNQRLKQQQQQYVCVNPSPLFIPPNPIPQSP